MFVFVCICVSELYLCVSDNVCEREHVFLCVSVLFGGKLYFAIGNSTSIIKILPLVQLMKPK